ncbi:MAG: SRPBCC family protein [Candidatus Melainabacteria bacterium]|nr:SRPBCC family protein [Candidatus Melainabacteria bacterium]
MTSRKNTLLLTFLLSAVLGNSGSSFAAQPKSHRGVESTVVIDASPKAVFEAIQHSRVQEPHRRKVVSSHDGIAVMDEHFRELPVIGNAHCTYKEVETPYKRIDFALLSSEKLKAFEGSWVLTPLGNGERTEVKLSTYSEPKVWLPFAKEVAGSSILKDIRRRLDSLKAGVESDDHCSITAQPDFQSISDGAKSVHHSIEAQVAE